MFSSFFTGLVLRLLGGEPLVGIPALLKYPMYNDDDGQLFPFKTFTMLCSLFTIIGISFVTHRLFTNNVINKKYDVFKCYHDDGDVSRADKKEMDDLLHLEYSKGKKDDNIDTNLLKTWSIANTWTIYNSYIFIFKTQVHGNLNWLNWLRIYQ